MCAFNWICHSDYLNKLRQFCFIDADGDEDDDGDDDDDTDDKDEEETNSSTPTGLVRQHFTQADDSRRRNRTPQTMVQVGKSK